LQLLVTKTIREGSALFFEIYRAIVSCCLRGGAKIMILAPASFVDGHMRASRDEVVARGKTTRRILSYRVVGRGVGRFRKGEKCPEPRPQPDETAR